MNNSGDPDNDAQLVGITIHNVDMKYTLSYSSSSRYILYKTTND
jgi:hypothetical protein